MSKVRQCDICNRIIRGDEKFFSVDQYDGNKKALNSNVMDICSDCMKFLIKNRGEKNGRKEKGRD